MKGRPGGGRAKAQWLLAARGLGAKVRASRDAEGKAMDEEASAVYGGLPPSDSLEHPVLQPDRRTLLLPL